MQEEKKPPVHKFVRLFKTTFRITTENYKFPKLLLK